MDRRRVVGPALTAFGALFVGVSLYRVWNPTVGRPNYWEDHTGGLLPLVLLTALGGALVVAGVATVFGGAAVRLDERSVRIVGAVSILAGLAAYEPVNRALATATGLGRIVYFGLHGVALVALAVCVVGVLARYPPATPGGRYASGLLAGGFLSLAGAEFVNWALLSVEPQTGALSYPPVGLFIVGTVALAVGATALGRSLHRTGDAPGWLGPLLVLVGGVAVPVGVLALFQYESVGGIYGLAWVVVGVLLYRGRGYSTSDFS